MLMSLAKLPKENKSTDFSGLKLVYLQHPATKCSINHATVSSSYP